MSGRGFEAKAQLRRLIVRMGLLSAVLVGCAVLTAGVASAYAAAPHEPDPNPPVWPFVVGAVAAVAVVAIWQVRRRP
ncbi:MULTISPECIES: hypothetical protein [Mycobacterium]|uniref:Uncharacterized protein n=1 Tax=Mycobacterium kiyosense TaxID=2871094 RepID=A0A9P3QC93_9MYCO|nr:MULTISPECIES: hypothetical protein [Mycobacterium]BDB45749.1 hypothetical protein IWGMT90018_61950 [Mycobacterium kiyosense]BDE11359.1 hypothetical protein MKCMC460_02190 [Mycobacterium sp. 20KCMC460]GLB85649.1 hypothetical protein SRL2020028_49050 [Mycobacterium kiyosense]GLB92378.1 hypothetical protein SRL2020130_51950 [Mycobacterium kiyosense]GLB98461.1 hypothetical protein SRL2020226_52370 [Mycobacterium kiyosense]